MRIRYLPSALRQLDHVLDYIDARNPRGADRVKERNHAVIELVAAHPMAGEATNRPAQRRVVVNPYPYVVYYRINKDEVVIQRVRHAARRPA